MSAQLCVCAIRVLHCSMARNSNLPCIGDRRGISFMRPHSLDTCKLLSYSMSRSLRDIHGDGGKVVNHGI